MLNIRRGATSGASSVLKVPEWPVRRKIVLVLALPVVLATVFGGLRVHSELDSASSYSTTKARATVLAPAISYVAAVERLTLPSSLADGIGDGKTNADQGYVAAAARFKAAAAGANLTSGQMAVVTAMTQSGDELHAGTGTGMAADPSVVISDLGRGVGTLINSTINAQTTPGARSQALIQSVNGRISLTQQQLLIESGAHQGGSLGATWLAAEIGVEGSDLASLKGLLPHNTWVNSLTSANVTRLGSAAGGANVKQLNATSDLFNKYDNLNARQLVKIDAALADLADTARQNALRDAAIILGALIASLALALVVARLLIRPIRRVRSDALAVATTHLPEAVKQIRAGKEPPAMIPIAVTTHEEIGQLARAVEDMQRQAVNLASGEAQLRSQVGAMFVTLSRRNNNLVNQQLALIESLEQNEEDPQRLEQLFSLDHLATRMRRTAESLVILGGTAGRTVGFEELTVSDAVHAAVSEVQDYQRVVIESTPDRRITGRTASDVVHLLAELLDNALSYSPPGSSVRVSAGYAEDGKGIQIEVVDSGLGMAGADLAAANESLKSGGEVTVDTARRMGLFVVSRLAEDHGLSVKLRRNTEGGGITASVLLPAPVLVALVAPAYLPSLMDEPLEPVEEPVTHVVEDDEETDPYLDRIEEAIAAVTGLPRRSPGRVRPPVAAPEPAVSMWDSIPPLELVGGEPNEDVTVHEPVVAEVDSDEGEVAHASQGDVADVVTADFSGGPSLDSERHAFEPDAEVATYDGQSHDEADVEPDTEDESSAEVDTEVAAQVETGFAEEVDTEADTEADTEDEFVAEATPADVDQPAEESLPVEVAPEPLEAGAVALAPAASTGSPDGAADVHELTNGRVITPDVPVRLAIRRPLSAAPAASALEGELVEDPNEGETSPIFGSLQSNWLSDEEGGETWTNPVVDAGWSAAKGADAVDNSPRTPAGLPVRRPGGRLVPGGVDSLTTPEPVTAVRDPEAIRNRLASHAAGVSRGRAAVAAAQPLTDDYAHEETGPA